MYAEILHLLCIGESLFLAGLLIGLMAVFLTQRSRFIREHKKDVFFTVPAAPFPETKAKEQGMVGQEQHAMHEFDR